MSANALRRRLDKLSDFAGGPPDPPFIAVQRNLVERKEDGTLWSRPYRRHVIGQPFSEMLNAAWKCTEEPHDEQKASLDTEK
ncbi:MAG: hypothetical protein K0U72_04920 [Gammaproteobacteria bacterium]|nr:hypothetical protein [Gammaproteobacteria bacterium]